MEISHLTRLDLHTFSIISIIPTLVNFFNQLYTLMITVVMSVVVRYQGDFCHNLYFIFFHKSVMNFNIHSYNLFTFIFINI